MSYQRIILSPSKTVDKQLMLLTVMLIQASQMATRLRAQIDLMTAGGANPEWLEATSEASIPAGCGANVYAAVTSIRSALDALAPTLAQFDQG